VRGYEVPILRTSRVAKTGTIFHSSYSGPSFSKIVHRGRGHLLTQPCGNGERIEADRTANLKTRDAVRRYELVDMTLGHVQQLRNIRDEKGVPSFIERTYEARGFLAQVSFCQYFG
jgi:hypothetical protein